MWISAAISLVIYLIIALLLLEAFLFVRKRLRGRRNPT